MPIPSADLRRLDAARRHRASPRAEARRRWLRPLLMFGVPLIVLAIGGYLWLTSGRYVSTDNAYVQQDKVSVSADVGGRIVEVAVRENQQVKAGDLLFRIDPEPYRIAVAQADAAIANAQVEVADARRPAIAAPAPTSRRRATRISSAQQDYARQAELMKRGFTTRARLEQSQHAVEQARAALASAQADAAEARAKLADRLGRAGREPARSPPRSVQRAQGRARPRRAPRCARRSTASSARRTGCRSAR